MGKKALIIVDVQYDFLPPDGSLAVPNGRDVIPVIRRLLDPSNEWATVIASQDYHPTEHISFASTQGGEVFSERRLVDARGKEYTQVLWPAHCVAGTRGCEIAEEINESLQRPPKAQWKLVRKGWHSGIEAYSAFEGYLTDSSSDSGPPNQLPALEEPANSELAKYLRKLGVEEVVVTGVATDYCVMSTAVSSLKAGFQTVVLGPAVRGIDPKGVDAALDKVKALGGRVVDEDEAAAYLASIHDSHQSQRPRPSALSTALLTGKSLFLLQLFSRAMTFVLNQALVRLSTPEVFGTASIQFDLISSTILFLSREGVRNALLRRQLSSTGSATSSSQGRLANAPFFVGWAVASAVVGIYLASSSQSTRSQPNFIPALGLYVVASLLELSIEPCYIRSLVSNPPKIAVRVQAEGGMAVVKSIVTFVCLCVDPHQALLGFAIGQLAGALALAGRYIAEFGTSDLPFVPRKAKPVPADAETKSLAFANARQSLVKHVLTEADRIAVGRISPLSAQGGYAVAMNYGSLIARIVFQPIEETLHLHFSSQHPSKDKTTGPLLAIIIHLSAHLLLFLPAFLPPLLPPILKYLLPKHYHATSAPKTLETYLSFYIPLLSLNGILEAFHTATATPRQMGSQARWMFLSSGAFVASLYVLRVHSPVSTEQALVLASCVAMVVRIVYAFRHAQRIAGISPWALVPKWQVILATGGPAIFLRHLSATLPWQSVWSQWCRLIGSGGVLGLLILGITWQVEHRDFARLQRTMAGKSEGHTKEDLSAVQTA